MLSTNKVYFQISEFLQVKAENDYSESSSSKDLCFSKDGHPIIHGHKQSQIPFCGPLVSFLATTATKQQQNFLLEQHFCVLATLRCVDFCTS